MAFRGLSKAFCNPWIRFIVTFYFEFSFRKTFIISLHNAFYKFYIWLIGVVEIFDWVPRSFAKLYFNTVFEFSLIIRLQKYLFFRWFSEFIEFLSLKAYVIAKWSDIAVLNSLLKIEFVIMWSIADTVLFVTLVGLFIVGIRQIETTN